MVRTRRHRQDAESKSANRWWFTRDALVPFYGTTNAVWRGEGLPAWVWPTLAQRSGSLLMNTTNQIAFLIVGSIVTAACEDGGRASDRGATVSELRRVMCPPNKDFTCSDRAFWGAAADNFGQEGFPVDEDGCMRRQCRRDADCADNEVCFAPECYPPGFSCQDMVSTDGETYCGCSGDPACNGAYCKLKP